MTPDATLVKHQDELTEWVMSHLVNRTDCYGGHVTDEDGTIVRTTVRRAAASGEAEIRNRLQWLGVAEAVRRHFNAERAEDIIGLHLLDECNSGRFLALDIDAHSGTAGEDKLNWEAVLRVMDRLRQLELTHLVWDSDGRGGYHVMVVFDQPIKSEILRGFAGHLADGLPKGVHVDLFPRQWRLSKNVKYGNWIRLFGHHHKRSHMSRLLSFEEGRPPVWLEGDRMVQALLKYEANDHRVADNLPVVPEPSDTSSDYGMQQYLHDTGETLPVSKRTEEFLQGSPGEGSRNQRLFEAACDMWGCGYTVGEVRRVLGPLAIGYGLTQAEVTATLQQAVAKARTPGELQTYGSSLQLLDSEDFQKGPNNGHGTSNEVGDHGDDVNCNTTGVDAVVPDQASDAVGGGERSVVQHGDSRPAEHAARPVISNVMPEWVDAPTKSDPEKRKEIHLHRPADRVLRDIYAVSDEWPRLINDDLFIVNDKSDPKLLLKVEQLWAWLHEANDVRWRTDGVVFHEQTMAQLSPMTKAEFFHYMRQNSKHRYTEIHTLPHHPMLQGCYYIPKNLPSPTGEHLREVVSKLNANDEIDRYLLAAAMVTPGWGGPPGSRPIFLLTSEFGTGSGKTATASFFGDLWGGAIESTRSETIEQFKARLLDENALPVRCVIRDNIKGKLSEAELEAIVSSTVINAKRMYSGNAYRSNMLSWYFTANSPDLGRDIAHRSVIISLGKPDYGFNFIEWSREYLKKYRLHLIADILQFLSGPDQCVIEQPDRWTAWQQGVLRKFKGGNEMAAAIYDRRRVYDTDREDAQSIEEAICEVLIETNGSSHYDPMRSRVFFTNNEICSILIKKRIVEHRSSARYAARFVRERINSGLVSNLFDVRTPIQGFEWRGPKAASDAQIKMWSQDRHRWNPPRDY